jgi:hypothetical protein
MTRRAVHVARRVASSAGRSVYSSVTAATAKPASRRTARTSASAWKVGVEVEHEPPAGPDQRGHSESAQAQLVRREVVEAVERAHRRVEDAFDREVGQGHPAQLRLVTQALARDGEHRVGGVDADDPVAPRDQLAREEAGAAAQIEH